MKKILLLAMVLMMVSGCATVQPIRTGSGMPEVTICGISKNEVMEKFVAGLSMKGVNIRNTNNYQIVVSKPVDNPLIAALYGSRYDSTPEARVIFTFADVNNCIYIGARLQIVTNPGSGFERITDISRGKDAYQLQQDLEELKSTIERQYQLIDKSGIGVPDAKSGMGYNQNNQMRPQGKILPDLPVKPDPVLPDLPMDEKSVEERARKYLEERDRNKNEAN